MGDGSGSKLKHWYSPQRGAAKNEVITLYFLEPYPSSGRMFSREGSGLRWDVITGAINEKVGSEEYFVVVVVVVIVLVDGDRSRVTSDP